MPDKEADETENALSSMPDSTPGEQSALFLFPAYSFSHGLDKIKTGRQKCRPGCCVDWGAVHFYTPLNRTGEQILTDEKKSSRYYK